MTDVVATTKVRIEADTAGLKQQATAEINAAIPEVKEVKISADAEKLIDVANVQKSRLEQMRKELSDVTKLLADKVATRVSAEKAGGPLLEAFRRQQEEFAKDPQPTDEGPLREREAALRRQIFLQEGLANAAKRAAVQQVEADQAVVEGATAATAARETEAVAAKKAAAAEEDAARRSARSQIRSLTAGRTAGLGGLVAAGARLGLIGIAATAAFQAVGELQQSLRVTGDEAYTAEGKLRNLGAELLGGNLIGAIKAVTAERKAQFAGDLGDQITAVIQKEKAASDPLIITNEKLAAVRQKGKNALKDYIQTLLAFGKINIDQANALLRVNELQEQQAKLVEQSADAWANYQAAVEKAGSVTKAFGPDSGGGPRGPGGVAAQRPVTAGTPVFQAGSGGPDVAAAIRASINSRIADEQEIAAARVREARITQKITKEAFDTAKKNVQAGVAAANSAADEWRAYVEATTGVVLATQAAKTTAEQAAAAGQALGNAVRDAMVSAIADPLQQSAAALRAQKIVEGQARRRFEDAKKGTKEANEAYAAWKIEQGKTAALQNSINETAKANAKAAADSAKSAKQQALQNDIAAAELSGDTPRIKRAYKAAIAYWQAIADGTKKTSEEHQSAVANVISLTASLKDVGSGGELRQIRLQNDLAEAELKGLDTRPFLRALISFAKGVVDTAKVGTVAYEQARGVLIAARQNFKSTNTELNDLKRANAKARAALTESTADDEKLIRADIRYWTKRVAATKGMGIVHQKAIAELLRAEGDLKALVDDVKPTTTVLDLLTESTKAFTEHAGNIINAGNRFTADTFTSGIRNQIGTTPNAAGRARLGIDTGTLSTAIDRNTAALDRNTASRGGEPRGHPPALGRAGGASGGGTRWGSWGESWGAWSQKAGIN